jgi:hypothetical protein
MLYLRLLYQAMAMCLNEICSLIISGKIDSTTTKKMRIVHFVVTFCMLFFGILLYIIDNSEPESNTRNILGNFYSK